MQTLQNHFLLAMPSLTDPYFERSLVYLCEHNEEGAMGLVVNIPVEMSLETMLTQLQLNPPNNPELKQPVLQGGPVHADRGFVLHSFRPGFNSTLQVGDEMMVTTSKDILETLGTSEAPAHWLVALGYAGWERRAAGAGAGGRRLAGDPPQSGSGVQDPHSQTLAASCRQHRGEPGSPLQRYRPQLIGWPAPLSISRIYQLCHHAASWALTMAPRALASPSVRS